MKEMNVCFLILNYWPSELVGGAETQCRKQTLELSKNGVRCTVVTSRLSWRLKNREHDDGVSILRMGFLFPLVPYYQIVHFDVENKFEGGGPRRDHKERQLRARWKQITRMFYLLLFQLGKLDFLFEVNRWLRKNHQSIDVIHVHQTNWIAGFAGVLGKKYGIPVVCKEAVYPPMPEQIRHLPFSSKLREGMSNLHFICITPGIRDAFRNSGVPDRRLSIIPNGVEIPNQETPHRTGKTVIFVGNFWQGSTKAFDIMFSGWLKVVEVTPEARLLLVGRGDKKWYEDFLRAHGVLASVQFVGGVDGVDPYYMQSQVFVLPSRREGLSNALLESQSFGIPAVVSDIPSNVSVVTHEENGLVVPVGDAEKFAEAVIRLLNDVELRVRLGKNARRLMEREYSMQSVAQRLRALYGIVTGTDGRE